MLKRVLFLLCVFPLTASSAIANGFMQTELSASATGRGNAFVATADDVSAAMYNPSGKAWQVGWDAQLGYLVDYRNSSVRLAGGVAPNLGLEPNQVYVHAGWMPLDGNIGFTFAYTPMYYLQNDWGSVFGVANGVTTLRVDDVAADAVYAWNSSLAMSMGLDWYLSDINLQRGATIFQARDYASFGAHASLMWKFLPGWSLGVMARSGSSINLSNAGRSLKVRLPDRVQAGLAWQVADRWRIEGDVTWARWSRMRDMNLRSSAGAVVAANPLAMRDTVSFASGLVWTWREGTEARLGYAFEQGAQRAQGMNPMIADQDGHRVSIGFGGDAFGLHLDAAYSYTFYPKRVVTGAFAGTYRDRRQTIAVSMSRHF
ncbi:MAG: fatty acid transporter [Zetaproteobacteria bacterium]|nr:MAG: fatty acid transporter [Zetaproteobacteria bacterium]